jgi:hypothetical protein
MVARFCAVWWRYASPGAVGSNDCPGSTTLLLIPLIPGQESVGKAISTRTQRECCRGSC